MARLGPDRHRIARGRRSRARPLAFVLFSLAALGASGCGAGAEPDLDRGRQLFTAECGTCHALSQAGTTADVGPNLDAAFAVARRDGMTASTVAGVTKAQIDNPRDTTLDPGDPNYDAVYMPADLVTGQDAEDVAAYVGSVAGTGAEPPPFTAESYFTSSCGGCHILEAAGTSGVTGPDLDENLPGQSAAEIKESILAPGEEIVSGYDDVMPANFGDTLAPDQLNELTEYLIDSTQGGGGGSQ